MPCRDLSARLTLALLCLALAAPSGAVRLMVKADAPGPAHNGASWATAYLRVQDAVTAAGTSGAEIWVAAGSYQENVQVNSTTYGIQLYGGFSGTETDRAQRDPAAHVSTLNGGGLAPVVTFMPGAYSANTLDGFEIRAGKGAAFLNTKTGKNDYYGGGVLCRAWSSPSIRNNLIRFNNNTATYPSYSYGGGIASMGGSPVIESNQIISNAADYGAGIYCAVQTVPRIAGNNIESNVGMGAGCGIYAGLGATIVRNTIVSNGSAGGVYLDGSASADTSAPSTTVDYNLIRLNSGGGLSYKGGSVAQVGTPYIYVRNNLIQRNSGQQGAALRLEDFYGRISNNTILNNTFSTTYGNLGAISVRNAAGTGAPFFINNIIAYNQAGIYDLTGSTGIHPVVQTNCFFSNTDGSAGYDYYPAGVDPTGAGGNIKADPRFALVSQYLNLADYRLSATSPCVDAGDDTVATMSLDYDAEPRKDGAHVDMGAYEWIHGVTLQWITQPADTVVQETITPAPKVRILRPDGSIYPYARAAYVTLKPGSGGAGAYLSSHIGLGNGIGAYLVNGEAEFSSLYMFQAGAGNVLTASWAGVTADSQPFTEMLRVRCVATTGSDANDGSSWTAAKKTVSAALDGVLAPGGEVRVQTGTYVGNITVPSHATLLGGYALPPSASFRDPKAYETILDGGGTGAVVTFATGAAADTVVDGFTVRNGGGRQFGGLFGTPLIWKGGGFYGLNGSPTVRGNRITGNTATLGGGLYFEGGAPSILGNVIDANSAAAAAEDVGEGGGIALTNCAATVAGNRITGNTAAGSVLAERAVSTGAAIQCRGSNPFLWNNSIVGNTAPSRGSSIGILAASKPRLANNIIAMNGNAVVASTDSALDAWHNDLYANGTANYSGPGTPFAGNGNLLVDPLFVDRAVGDLHLQDASPCINAGDNSVIPAGAVDMDGVPRINDDSVDMGVYERRVLNVLSVAFEDATSLVLTYSDPIDTLPAHGALIPEHYYVTDLDNGGAPVLVDQVNRITLEPSQVTLRFAALPYGHRIRVAVGSVVSAAGILVNPLRNAAETLVPVQVSFRLNDYTGVHFNKMLTVEGTWNGWGRGTILVQSQGTYTSLSGPIWIAPGPIEYRYCVEDVSAGGGNPDCASLNPVNRTFVVPPVNPQTIVDVAGLDVAVTFHLRVFADRAVPTNKLVYATGGFCGWSTTPGATPGPIRLSPVAGAPGAFQGTGTIKSLVWPYRYVLVDRDTGAVDTAYLNAQDRTMDVRGSGAPLAFSVYDTAGTLTRVERAAWILRIAAGMEPAPLSAADPAFALLDTVADGRITPIDAVAAVRN